MRRMSSAASESSRVRESFRLLLNEVASPQFGYSVGGISFARAAEVTFQKVEGSFLVWIRPAAEDTRSYKNTVQFKIGYSGQPPDKLAISLLNALCDRLRAWEVATPTADIAALFETDVLASAPVPFSGPAVDPAIRTMLGEAVFTPVHRAWLPTREKELSSRLASLKIAGARNILLVNATKGAQFYPSTVDFFAALQRVHPGVRVTCTSYFPDVFEFQGGVDGRGVPRLAIADVEAWSDDQLKQYDVILSIGPNDLMLRLMRIPGLATRLVVLDVAFYHQLIESLPNWVPGSPMTRPDPANRDESRQINRVAGYSCQHAEKVAVDLTGVCSPRMINWTWFNYIPVGFTYARHYQSDRHRFDVALLGSNGRDYSQLDPARLAGVRFVFLGVIENVPELQPLRDKLDLTVIPRVDEDTYARLLAVSRCVAFPFRAPVKNCLVSVVDALASGVPSVTASHAGFNRLEAEGVPVMLFNPDTGDLSTRIRELLDNEPRRQDLSRQSIAFTREHMDMYGILERIVAEQVV